MKAALYFLISSISSTVENQLAGITKQTRIARNFSEPAGLSYVFSWNWAQPAGRIDAVVAPRKEQTGVARMRFLRAICLLGVLSISTVAQAAADRPLNIIFILVDDMGWTDLGVMGSDLYETPNIDRLAAEGTRFTQAYSACTVCSPTRAAILTGKYPARLHLTDWIHGHKRPKAKLQIPAWTEYLPTTEVSPGLPEPRRLKPGRAARRCLPFQPVRRQSRSRPPSWRIDFESHLVGLKLHQRLVGLHRFSGLFEPLANGRFGNRLPERRNTNLNRHFDRAARRPSLSLTEIWK